MRHYTIFWDNYMPVYEGIDGLYWLGGSARFLNLMVFSSKKSAEEALKNIKIRIKQLHNGMDWLSRNPEKLSVGRFKIVRG